MMRETYQARLDKVLSKFDWYMKGCRSESQIYTREEVQDTIIFYQSSVFKLCLNGLDYIVISLDTVESLLKDINE